MIRFSRVLATAPALLVLFGCSSGDATDPARVADLVMPAAEHPGLGAVEIVLAIDDVERPPAAAPGIVARALMEAGVVSAANATYAWGEPDSLLLIDANVHRFSTPGLAIDDVLLRAEEGDRIDGIGDAATLSGGRSLSFSVDATKVTLTTISDEVDLRSVAKTYAAWLEGR